jgi:hypothetical protein
MSVSNLKQSLLNTYLAQQYESGEPDGKEQAIIETPTDAELEEFKNYVKAFIDVDNDIRKLKQAIKERNTLKTTLSINIVKFMSKFSIEDLNTKHGKIRYTIQNVKKPLSKAEIRCRLLETYDPSLTAMELADKVFNRSQGETEVKQKHVLKRLT